MEQFEYVCFGIELNKGCDGRIAKRGRANNVCFVDERSEIGWRKLIGGDEEREDVDGKLLVGKTSPFRLPVFWESWDVFGNVEPAVGCKAGKDNLPRMVRSARR